MICAAFTKKVKSYEAGHCFYGVAIACPSAGGPRVYTVGIYTTDLAKPAVMTNMLPLAVMWSETVGLRTRPV